MNEEAWAIKQVFRNAEKIPVIQDEIGDGQLEDIWRVEMV